MAGLPAQTPSAEETAKGLKIAEQEMEYRVDLFNRCAAP